MGNNLSNQIGVGLASYSYMANWYMVSYVGHVYTHTHTYIYIAIYLYPVALIAIVHVYMHAASFWSLYKNNVATCMHAGSYSSSCQLASFAGKNCYLAM